MIRIEAADLPGRSCGPSAHMPDGHDNVHVGVQRRNRRDELLDVVAGDAPSAEWSLECEAVVTPEGVDLKGPYIQGPPGERFIYLSWVNIDDAGVPTLFRRAKLWLDAVPNSVVTDAVELGVLVARLGLTDDKGNPLCAAVRPPSIEWSAGRTS